MKRKVISFMLMVHFCFFLTVLGCVTRTPNLKMPKPLPSIIKEYKHVILYGGAAGMKNTGIHLNDGDTYSILATGSIDYWPGPSAPGNYKWHDVRPELGWPFMARIGERYAFRPFARGGNSYTDTTYDASGNLYIGYKAGPVDLYGKPERWNYYRDDSGYFSVDIIVWAEKDYTQIVDFFEEMRKKDPQNVAIQDALQRADKYKEWYFASLKTTEKIEETKEEIKALKKEPKKEEMVKTSPEKKTETLVKKPDTKSQKVERSKVEAEKQEKIVQSQEKPILEAKTPKDIDEKEKRMAQLEEKLKKFMEELSKLEETKKKFDEEKEKTRRLTEALEENERKEQELMVRLKESSKTSPVIVIAAPKDGSKVEVNITQISGVAEDEEGLARVEIFINGKPLKKMKRDRGIMVTGERNPKRLEFRERIPLEKGVNRIKIRAVDRDGLTSEKIMTVQYVEKQKRIWAVVIGINAYSKIRQLKYAVNDAKIVRDHLVNYNHIPVENLTLLLDQDATLTRLRSALGTHLKKKAGKHDMVIIFFAGHGATEKDVMSPDGDGLEKYLLPYDADPDDLYATALPMGEISKVFNRIRSERLVFIVDSCYSGASGGRTIGITGVRANISDAFLDRIASGKGRVILSASGANEVSAEKDELEHGVFTYYLVEGWRGKADEDQDGIITVDEVYRYVSEHVPQATGQEQHPVKKGTVEGRLILGVVE